MWGLVFLAGVILFIWFLGSPFYWKKRGVPGGLPLPFFGSLLPVFREGLVLFTDRLYRSHPDSRYFGFHLFTKPVFVVKDPALLQDVFIGDHDYFLSHGFYVNHRRDLGSSNIFFSDGEQWRQYRSKLSPHFTPARVKAAARKLEPSLQHLVERVEEKRRLGPVDIRDLMVRYTIQVLTSSIYGFNSDTLLKDKSVFKDVLHSIFNYTFLLRLIIGLISQNVYNLLRLTLFGNKATSFFFNITPKIIKERNASPTEYSDLLQGLINLKSEETNKTGEIRHNPDGTIIPWYDDSTISCHVLTLFAGGTESPGTVIAFSLHELAVHGDIQERARDEILEALRVSSGRSLSYEELQKLTYVNMILQETMRLYPPFHTIYRKCTKRYPIKDSAGLVLEPGCLVLVPAYSLHRDPKYFPRPEVFDPERFSEETKLTRPPIVYLPFGHGPRACIGTKFSFAEMTLALVTLLSRYKFSLSAKSSHPAQLSHAQFLTSPKSTLWLDVTPLS